MKLFDIINSRSISRPTNNTHTDEITPFPSVLSRFPPANWWERENWIYLVFFFPIIQILSRILTNYGLFEGHPLRKHFPFKWVFVSNYVTIKMKGLLFVSLLSYVKNFDHLKYLIHGEMLL